MERLRQESLTSIGKERVREVKDFGRGVAVDLTTGQTSPIELPREDVLQWITEQGSKVSLRPSGTEPKMKLYLEVRGPTRQDAEIRLQELKEACHELIVRGLGEN